MERYNNNNLNNIRRNFSSNNINSSTSGELNNNDPRLFKHTARAAATGAAIGALASIGFEILKNATAEPTNKNRTLNLKNKSNTNQLIDNILGSAATGAALGATAYVSYKINKAYTVKEVEQMPETFASVDLVDPCPICLDSFKSKDLLKKLQCGHQFHSTCILEWIKNKSNCPVCREDC